MEREKQSHSFSKGKRKTFTQLVKGKGIPIHATCGNKEIHFMQYAKGKDTHLYSSCEKERILLQAAFGGERYSPLEKFQKAKIITSMQLVKEIHLCAASEKERNLSLHSLKKGTRFPFMQPIKGKEIHLCSACKK